MSILGIIRDWFIEKPEEELTKVQKKNAYYRKYYADNKDKIKARRALLKKNNCEG